MYSDSQALANNLSKRFATAASGNTYNSVSDFPTTGSGFGVNTQALTLYAGFVIPEYSRICFMNYGGSPDAAISAVSQSGEIYSAFRSSGTWQNGKVSASKDDLALVSLLLSGTSEVSSSNLYATMKGKREIQVSGWFRTSSTKPTGTKIFSIPSGYTIGINITLLAMESVSGAIIALWGDQRGTTFTTQREIPAGQYYVIPIPIQLQSA